MLASIMQVNCRYADCMLVKYNFNALCIVLKRVGQLLQFSLHCVEACSSVVVLGYNLHLLLLLSKFSVCNVGNICGIMHLLPMCSGFCGRPSPVML